MLLIAALLLLAIPPVAATPTVARISNGFLLPENEFVGTTTSALQAFIDERFPPVAEGDWSSASLLDDSVLRYLFLGGQYTADATLRLPSLFVLRLDGSMTIDASILGQAFPTWQAMVMMDGVHYSVVDGGTYDATGANIQALSMVFASRCSIQNVKATGNFDAVIGLYGGQTVGQNSVLNSEIGPDNGRVPGSTGRGIWTISETKPYIVNNYVHYTALYGIDIDAYTTNAIVHGNTAEHCELQGIFVEENATNNVVAGNTVRFSGKTGISLYSNIEGPVANNVIVGNLVTDNVYSGLTAGGTKTDQSINFSTGNSFVANEGMDNGRGFWVNQYGNLLGADDFWVGNTESGTTPQKWFGEDGAAWPDGAPFPQDSSVVAMLDPEPPDTDAPTSSPVPTTSLTPTKWPIDTNPPTASPTPAPCANRFAPCANPTECCGDLSCGGKPTNMSCK